MVEVNAISQGTASTARAVQTLLMSVKAQLKKWQRQVKCRITNWANWKDSRNILLLCETTKITEICNIPL